ncbi:MAG: tetratricopeptide repeat protein [Bacteroidales bacterium]|jgi:tetratricopeptide (TPR) repeat protein|nr:tetratricopeptide repeat protein [Bacteroidales bacterium]
MKKLIAKNIFIITILLFYLTANSQTNPEKIALSKQYVENNQYKEAKEFLQNLLKDDSENSEILSIYGFSLLKLGETDSAILYFEKSIKLNQNCALCYAGLAKFCYEENPEKANKYLEKATNIDPTIPFIYYVKGLIFRKNKEYDKAISEFSKALYFDNKNLDYLFERGGTYMLQNELHKAITDYQNILKIDILDSKTHYYLAYTFMMNNDLEKAETSIEDAIKADSTNAEYFNLLFSILYQKKEFYDAESALFKSLEINPDDFNVYINLGDLYFQANQYDAFCEAYQKALEKIPATDKAMISEIKTKTDKFCNKNSDAYFYLRSQGLFSEGKYNESIEMANRGLKINKQSSILYNLKSSAFIAQNKFVEAEIETNNSLLNTNNLEKEINLYQAVQLTPEQIVSMKNSYIARIYFQKAIIQLVKQDYDNSLQSLNTGYELATKEKTFPGIEFFHILKSINYIAMGNIKTAETSINAAHKSNPKNPICSLFTAYYLLFSACEYVPVNLQFEYNEDIKVPRIILPTLSIKVEQKSNLQDAILLCDRLIQRYPKNPYSYLIKAKAMQLLDVLNYQEIAKEAEELGVKDVYKELNIKK